MFMWSEVIYKVKGHHDGLQNVKFTSFEKLKSDWNHTSLIDIM